MKTIFTHLIRRSKVDRPKLSNLDARKAGFSLIEVNVAILVIAGGMLSLFTLFPAGLRLSTAAMSDTRQVLFADQFFAFFEDGLISSKAMRDVTKWQKPDEFWKAGREGLENGFDHVSINDKWPDSDLRSSIIDSWDPDLDKSGKDLFRMKKNNVSGGGTQGNITLRFCSGVVSDYFSKSTKTGKLDAEFVVRIASDFPEKFVHYPNAPGNTDNYQEKSTHNSGTKYKDKKGVEHTTRGDDNLVWRVSLIVSDEGENGWFYDNAVYHRDFRYAALP